MSFLGIGKKKPALDSLQSDLDKSLDMNSGLQLDSLNQNPSPEPAVDSFGNPRSQRTYEPERFQTNLTPQQSGNDMSKDIEIIIAKLDAIKAEVGSISHRLDILENSSKQPPTRRYPL